MKTIKTIQEYIAVMERIELFLNIITEAGEADCLTLAEHDELKALSIMAADYDDSVLKIHPLAEPTPLP